MTLVEERSEHEDATGFESALAGCRVAVAHEWIESRAGSEKTFEQMAAVLPSADLYAVSHTPGVALETGGRPICTTSLDRPRLRGARAATLPFMPLAWRAMRTPAYDLVVTSSHAFVRAFPAARRALHLSYTHTPARYLWLADLDHRGVGAPARAATALLAPPLRRIDHRLSRHVDGFAANSSAVRDRVHDVYGRDSVVIHPPCDTEYFAPGSGDGGGFVLSVGRFVPYKRHDLAIEAVGRTGRDLVIAGTGPDEQRLRRLAAEHLPGRHRFVVAPRQQELRRLYQEAQLLVFAGFEDFGIVPVEAQACGTPVVALAAGGSLDTVLPGVSGLLVDEQTSEAFADGIETACQSDLDRVACRASTERFSPEVFRRALRRWILQAIDHSGDAR